MRIERYAKRVMYDLILGMELPGLLKVFSSQEVTLEEINYEEALIFSLLPYVVIANSPHFFVERHQFINSLLEAASEHMFINVGTPIEKAREHISTRLSEYSRIMFENNDTSLSVSEEGLTQLAKLATTSIVSLKHATLSDLLMVSSFFANSIISYKGGEVLKKFYNLCLKMIDKDDVRSGSKKVIYYVDSEDDILCFAKSFLGKRGYNVSNFSIGEDVVREMDKTLPDLVICDLNREGLTGIEFFNEIREKASRGQTKILVVSGIQNAQNMRLLRPFIDARLPKPVNIENLEDVVKRLCDC